MLGSLERLDLAGGLAELLPPLPRTLSADQARQLLEIDVSDGDLACRDRAILELFYASGLRLSELVGLDLEDINLSSRLVRVLGKGGKERIIPFNQKTAAAVRQYLGDRGRTNASRFSWDDTAREVKKIYELLF